MKRGGMRYGEGIGMEWDRDDLRRGVLSSGGGAWAAKTPYVSAQESAQELPTRSGVS